jgi:putative oxidoreductase
MLARRFANGVDANVGWKPGSNGGRIMPAFLSSYEDRIYALLRIVAGLLFLCHGAQKLFGLFGGPPAEMSALLWAAGLIEFFGGALVMIGLFAGWSAFICSGQMAVAYFMVHQQHALLPIANKGELSALYAWIFLFIAARGAGVWSVDAARRGT